MSGAGKSNITQGFPQLTSPAVKMPSGFFTQPWYQFMITLWQRTGTAQGSAVSPTGMIMAFSAITPPPGWLLADGSAVSRTIYAALYSVVGNVWGSGDGSTTFNIPNLTNRFLVGYGNLSFGSRGGAIPLTGGTSNGYAAIAWCVKT